MRLGCPATNGTLEVSRIPDAERSIESESDDRVVSEAADTLYHLVVALRWRAIPLRRVLAELARRLKKLCGAGGGVREGVIEIQGEHRDRLVAELCKLGYPARRSGG